MRLWNVLLSCCLVVAAGLGLLVLSGSAKRIAAPPLEAHLVLQEFPIPEGFGIEPARVAGYMAGKLVRRMDGDIAMRMTLDQESMKKVKEIVLPRLMNVVVVQEMMRDIPELSAILELGAFRGTVTGQVSTTEAARDVALTVPGALLAEVDGEKVAITTTSTGLTALVLGDMEPGQVHQVKVWFGEAGMTSDLERTIRIGSDASTRGRVLIWGRDGWFGADVEALRWSRWLIGALLGGTLLFGLASLVLPLLTARQDRSRRGGVNATAR
ncbi:MAG: hypothetical protein HOY44_13605 [Maritimibacter sp.]|uniref:hypothetical protein n=1 Tax=Maritimibacter sp. TaxID=2003363 RepID=UPI001DD1F437|nr:hypothetical protein [Maritimibacter sp.]MBL6428558.1 hypothetical protein [Maritimibacter sp.]